MSESKESNLSLGSRFAHYKGNRYKIICLPRHCSDDISLVVYAPDDTEATEYEGLILPFPTIACSGFFVAKNPEYYADDSNLDNYSDVCFFSIARSLFDRDGFVATPIIGKEAEKEAQVTWDYCTSGVWVRTVVNFSEILSSSSAATETTNYLRFSPIAE